MFLKYYETVKKFDNLTKTSRNFRDFEIGPSDDLVFTKKHLTGTVFNEKLP